MIDLRVHEGYRQHAAEVRHYGTIGDATCGVFRFPSRTDGQPLNVIASSDGGWDHVSVSRSNRCPNWPEMEFIKRMFFKDDETVMQLHVPEREHVNFHPHTLHLWRPQNYAIPRPPDWMVGPKTKPMLG